MSTAPFESVFRSQHEEHTFLVSKVAGEIRKDLSGTLLRNGPGRMELGGDHLNFFDGHGLVAGVSFETLEPVRGIMTVGWSRRSPVGRVA